MALNEQRLLLWQLLLLLLLSAAASSAAVARMPQCATERATIKLKLCTMAMQLPFCLTLSRSLSVSSSLSPSVCLPAHLSACSKMYLTDAHKRPLWLVQESPVAALRETAS